MPSRNSSLRQIRPILGVLITFLGVITGLCSCSGVLPMSPASSSSSGSFAWRGPFYADLAMFNRSTDDGSGDIEVACFEPTVDRSSSWLPEGGGSTYVDLELARFADRLVYAGSFCLKQDASTSQYRAFSRTYIPVSEGGDGWGEEGTLLSPGVSGGDVLDVLLAADSVSGKISAQIAVDAGTDLFMSALYFPNQGWGGFDANIESDLTAGALLTAPLIPISSPASAPLNRYPSSTFWASAWDSRSGDLYLGYQEDSPMLFGLNGLYVSRASSSHSTFSGLGPRMEWFPVMGAKMLSDGFGATLIWNSWNQFLDILGVNTTLFAQASWEGNTEFDDTSSNLFSPPPLAFTRTISTPTSAVTAVLDHANERFIPDFAAASDGAGTVLAVYLQWDPGFTGSCAALAPYCNYRLFASVRNITGEWIGPTPLDEHLQVKRTTTTYYQDSSAEGGIAQARPQVVYVGDGRFLVASVYTDASDTSAPFAQIYTRGYTLGKGWDPSDQIVELGDPQYLKRETETDSYVHYRPINDVHLAADPSGSGNLVLVSQHLDDDLSHYEPASREYRHSVYRYVASSSAWSDAELIPVDLGCPAFDGASLTYCNRAQFGASVFSSGETVVLVPVNTTSSGTGIVLGSYEYRQKSASEREEED